MSYRDNSDPELAGFVTNLTNTLSAHKVKCLDDALADELAAQIGALNVLFKDNIKESSRLTAEKQSVNEKKKANRSLIINRVANVQRYLDACDGTESNYDICGFNFRRKWTSVVAKTPDELSAVGNWVNGNKLKFDGNNARGRVNYEIYRSEGKTGTNWTFVGTTKKQSFKDTTAVPGQCYQYKVRAVAPRSVSSYSNTAIVYSPV